MSRGDVSVRDETLPWAPLRLLASLPCPWTRPRVCSVCGVAMPPHGARGVPGGGASGATALPVRLLQVECGLAPPLSSLQQVPAALPRSFAAADEASGRALTHLLELRQASQTHNPRAARDALHSLSGACEFLTPGMEARTSAPARAAQGLVVSTGGWQLLLPVLSPSWDSQPDNASPLNPHLLADIRAEACAILRELCCAVPSLSEAVAATPGLGARLFRLVRRACPRPHRDLTATAS